MTSPSSFRLICAPVTAFDDDGELDLPATRRLFSAIHAAGIQSIFTPGTTGEFTSLDDEERLAVIDAALEEFGAGGVIAHIGAATTRHTVRLARAAANLGATALAAITPYYFPTGERAITAHVKRVTDAAPDAAHYVYVFPARTGNTVAPQTLAALAEIPGVVGAKVSGLPFAHNEAYLAAVPAGFELYSGNDVDLVRLAQDGFSGVVSGVANVFPELFVRAAHAVATGQDAAALQPALDEAVAATAGADLGLLKAGLAARGLGAGIPRISIEPPSDAAVTRLRELIETSGAAAKTQRNQRQADLA